MKRYLTRGWLVFLVLLLTAGSFIIWQLTKEETPDWMTGTVTKGSVREIVSVSGVIEAEGEASLSFPTTGIVSDILVEEGTIVTRDQILATLEQSELQADRQDAYAALLIAEADRSELIQGPRSEARAVTASTVAIAEADLDRTISEENKKVENAYRTLLSDDLEALPLDRDTIATPPTISGTYTCDDEGSYLVNTFRSGSQSGYSYRLSGLETGTFTAYTEAPAPFGNCGLSIQFSSGAMYGNKTWEITIPNTRGASYTTNLNAYTLAQEQATNAIDAATQARDQARNEQLLQNATPRTEALARADASVLQAQARLAAIDARIKERTLRAPFEGVVSDITFTEGEVASGHTVTLIASNIFELSVRIPEIDITKLHVGQSAQVRFDARADEVVDATIGYISGMATEIDGVAYFEAKLQFATTPQWFRSGLNADVDIIVDEKTDTLKLPKRFVVTEGNNAYVLLPNGTETRKESVQILFSGNDGFVAVSGNLNEGDTVIAP